jgi:hypothetical protein
VYLQAEQNSKPAVIGMVLYARGDVYIEPTLAQVRSIALGQAPATYAVGGAAVTAPAPSSVSASTAPTGGAVPQTATDITGLIEEAYTANQGAQDSLRNRDFAGYEQAEAELQAVLQRL